MRIEKKAILNKQGEIKLDFEIYKALGIEEGELKCVFDGESVSLIPETSKISLKKEEADDIKDETILNITNNNGCSSEEAKAILDLKGAWADDDSVIKRIEEFRKELNQWKPRKW